MLVPWIFEISKHSIRSGNSASSNCSAISAKALPLTAASFARLLKY